MKAHLYTILIMLGIALFIGLCVVTKGIALAVLFGLIVVGILYATIWTEVKIWRGE